jgi:hypothetical protein
MRPLILFLLLIVVAVAARYANENPRKWRASPSPAASVADVRQTESRQPASRPQSETPDRSKPPKPTDDGWADESDHIAELAADRTCKAPPTKPVEKAAAPKIHRWVDADGKVQFSDKRPANTNTEIYQPRIRSRKQFFDVEITYEGMRSVPFLKDRLRAQITKMYEILALLVGDSRLRQVELNIRLFEYAEDYKLYAQTISPRLANTGGFYSLARNEAVTYQHRTDESTHETARHEAMHVIAAGLFGRVPTWLNEGLAEYFETLSVENQRVTITPQPRWFEMAAQAHESGYPSELRTYMALRDADWYDNNRDVHYAIAWSLVHFLMSSDRGRAAIANYLQELADQYCERVDAFAWLKRGYPGGYEGFARDFDEWLARGQIAAHTH